MLDPELLALLVCPETHQDVVPATPLELAEINRAIQSGLLRTVVGVPLTTAVDGALIRIDRAVAYPIHDDIPVMLIPEGIVIAQLNLAREGAAHA